LHPLIDFPPVQPEQGFQLMRIVGTVAIGRNEGQRLIDCLQSLRNLELPIVYVDSGSSDGSQAAAQALGADVVALDMSRAFTAARARNVGFYRLCQIHPDVEFVQFIDGDCALNPSWIPAALACAKNDATLAVLFGRLRERHPSASIYNRLCEMEWDIPLGLTSHCGGIALMRREAFVKVGGFNDRLIAGEEPELCFRLQKTGWSIRHIDTEMALHDAAMSRPGQWLKRAVRGGHAFAEGAWLHRAEGLWRRECLSISFWALILPAVAAAAAYFTYGASMLLLLAYPLLMLRILMARSRRSSVRHSALYAFACVVGKFPQAFGVLTFHWNRVRGRQSGLIEYKGPASRRTS
jgi:GT2 family glycosyltransferase